MTAWLLLATALLLIVACGVFVAAEFSFVTVDRTKVDQAAAAGDPAREGLQQALRSLSTQLSGAQVGITITNLAIGYLAEPAISDLIDGPLEAPACPEGAIKPVAVGIGLTVGTILTMIFGELVPKNLALAKPMEVARATQRFQRAFTAVDPWPDQGPQRLGQRLRPPARASSRRRSSARRAARPSSPRSIQRSADLGTLDVETAELMERSVEFGSRTAGEIMTPRVRSNSLDVNDRAIAVIELTRETGHSRFPVVDADENVVGTVHVKHAVALPAQRARHHQGQAPDGPADRRARLAAPRPAARAAAQGRVPDGCRHGRVRRVRRASSPSRTSSRRSSATSPTSTTGSAPTRDCTRDGTWSLSGLLRPDEVEDLTGIELPDHEDYDTIAGLVLQVLGRVPEAGDLAEVARAGPLRPRRAARAARRPHRRPDGRPADRPAHPAAARRREHRRPGGRTMSSATAIVLAIFLLLGNAFFVGAEFALVSARRTQIEPRAEAGLADGQDHDQGDGEHLPGDRGQPARHHRLLAGARCRRRAGRRPPGGAGTARPPRAGGRSCTRSRS